MAYSKKAEKDLSSWFSPVYNKFIKDHHELLIKLKQEIEAKDENTV